MVVDGLLIGGAAVALATVPVTMLRAGRSPHLNRLRPDERHDDGGR
jgi:hypothetical protein